MNSGSPAVRAHEIDDSKSVLGFWIYLMTDCVLFATLFATYIVLRNNTFGGPGAAELFSLPFILIATLALLTSSFTSGLAVLAARHGSRRGVAGWLGVTFVLGAVFLGMELYEFSKLIAEGNGWQRNAFLSAFFTLVATHGIHIASGMLWIVVLLVSIARRGLDATALKRLSLFGLFWHFLDIVWIFIFTIVYLMGAV